MNKKDMTPLREKIKEKCAENRITSYKLAKDLSIRWETANKLLNTDLPVLRGTLLLVSNHLKITV